MSFQTEKVVLEAEVSNQKLEKNSDETFYKLVLPIKLKLSNKQKKPLLLIREAIQVVGVRIATTESNLKKKIYLHDGLFLPSFKQESLRELAFPTSNVVEKVSPNEKYVWNENYWITVPERKPNGLSASLLSLEDLKISDGLMDTIWVEFDVAFFPMHSMHEEGEKLKNKWRDTGTLLVETVTTRPIEISIPKFIDFRETAGE